MNWVAADILSHTGVGHDDDPPGRGSGRMPWGSGDNPYQHGTKDFYSRVQWMRKQNPSFTDPDTGITYHGDTAIAKMMEMSTGEFRARYTLAKNEHKSRLAAQARELRNSGKSLDDIAKEMGYKNDSSIRALLNQETESRRKQAQVTADYLKELVDKQGMTEVGAGAELELHISKEKLKQALKILEKEGYKTYGGRVPQVTNPNQQTTIQVLCPPGTEHKEIYDYSRVHSVVDYEKELVDNGRNVRSSFEYPSSMDSKRLKIVYAEDGGIEKDGLIEIRPGVKDLSLGKSTYAQVRILVDGTHYLKGMAVYNDHLPEGVDIQFNTNKHAGTPALGNKSTGTVLKEINKTDPKNPFGSLIKERGGQSYYDDPNGKYIDQETGKKQSLSLINKRAEEGEWGEWAKKLPSQFLAKQPLELINNQLGITIANKRDEFNEIKALTNPTIKKALLNDFAESCDSDSYHLQAAALPNMRYQVILPIPSVGDKEVYAPNFENGTKVALVRYPHGGIFEIPILTVNNKNKEGREYLGVSPKDAVGISAKTAQVLSGADFDGDTVMVIPIGGKVNVKNREPLRELEGFDPKDEYGPNSPGSIGKEYPRLKKSNVQREMGTISNLITDMTLQGASEDKIARAVKHSMVIIDAEKHGLDYKRSFVENRIAELKREYQGHIKENGRYGEGAGTLLSRAKSQYSVPKRKGAPKIDEEGNLVYKTDPDLEYTYTTKTGKVKTKERTQKSYWMLEVDDARKLLSEHPSLKEQAYADYANALKQLARDARIEVTKTGNLKYNKTAAKTYEEEVKALQAHLKLSELNQPREKQAQLIANSKIQALKDSDIYSNKKEMKKYRNLALRDARELVGASRKPISFTDREWEAIQAGAIHDTTLKRIIRYANKDELRERATPKSKPLVSDTRAQQFKALLKIYSAQEVADKFGVSVSTVYRYAKE